MSCFEFSGILLHGHLDKCVSSEKNGRHLKLLDDACPSKTKLSLDRVVVADLLHGHTSHWRSRSLDLGKGPGERRRHRGKWYRCRQLRCRPHHDLFGDVGLLLGHGLCRHAGDDAHVHHQETHAQQVKTPDLVLKLDAFAGPKDAGADSETDVPLAGLTHHHAVEVLAQLIASALELPEQPAEPDFVLHALELGYILVVGLILDYRTVDGVEKGQDLARGGNVGDRVPGRGLGNDGDRDHQSGEGEKLSRTVAHGGVRVVRMCLAYFGGIPEGIRGIRSTPRRSRQLYPCVMCVRLAARWMTEAGIQERSISCGNLPTFCLPSPPAAPKRPHRSS